MKTTFWKILVNLFHFMEGSSLKLWYLTVLILYISEDNDLLNKYKLQFLIEYKNLIQF